MRNRRHFPYVLQSYYWDYDTVLEVEDDWEYVRFQLEQEIRLTGRINAKKVG